MSTTHNIQDNIQQTGNATQGGVQKAQDTATDLVGQGSATAQDAAGRAQDGYKAGKDQAVDTYRSGKNQAKDTYYSGKNQAKDTYYNGKSQAIDGYNSAREEASAYARDVVDGGKQYVQAGQEAMGDLIQQGQAQLDRVVPPEQRGETYNNVNEFARERPYLATFLLIFTLFAAPPVFVYAAFASGTVLVAVLAAGLFCSVFIGLATALLLPALGTSFLFSIAVWLWAVSTAFACGVTYALFRSTYPALKSRALASRDYAVDTAQRTIDAASDEKDHLLSQADTKRNEWVSGLGRTKDEYWHGGVDRSVELRNADGGKTKADVLKDGRLGRVKVDAKGV